MTTKCKLAVIGHKDSVMIFQALGIHTLYADSEREIETGLHKLARDEYSIIYITEQAAEQIPEAIEKYKTELYPAIIPIPNRFGSNGLGMKGIQDNIEKAIGADIL